MKEPTQFLTNEKGEKIAVVIEMKEYSAAPSRTPLFLAILRAT